MWLAVYHIAVSWKDLMASMWGPQHLATELRAAELRESDLDAKVQQGDEALAAAQQKMNQLQQVMGSDPLMRCLNQQLLLKILCGSLATRNAE